MLTALMIGVAVAKARSPPKAATQATTTASPAPGIPYIGMNIERMASTSAAIPKPLAVPSVIIELPLVSGLGVDDDGVTVARPAPCDISSLPRSAPGFTACLRASLSRLDE